LIRERDAAGTVQVRQFYIRRILRIWPLYYLGLTLGVIVAFLPGSNRAEIAVIGWFGIFLSTWIMPAHGWIANPVSPLWSISVEEQFYAFAPWLAKYLGRKSLYGLCVVLILLSDAWLFYLGNVRAPLYRIWHNPFVQFESFAAGILLCLALRGRLPRVTTWLRIVLLAGGWACWFLACYWLNALFDPNKNPGGWALVGGFGLGALGSVVMLIAFLGVHSSLLPKWAIYLGRISFGLYVYHRFAIDFVARLLIFNMHSDSHMITSHFLNACRSLAFEFVLPLALTIVVAMLSYRFYETPFLKMKRRHAVVESQPVAGVEEFLGPVNAPRKTGA
jgi:peptidoglycan/LPS O-acetylase OafA/YrhL